MARSDFSPSPSPISATSPSFSDSSDDNLTEPNGLSLSASHPGSPSMQHESAARLEAPEVEDSVTCQWEECGQVFTHLPTLIDHIHNDHIGVHKSNYTCEWATCQRRGLAQTSRFALISHIRSHTGEKPFTCFLPECDKSFTRSDALAKHMRLQHNISPPAPGRGGSRKRKRADDAQAPTPSGGGHARTPPPPATGSLHTSNGTFNTFKVEPNNNDFLDDVHQAYERDREQRECPPRNHTNGHRSASPHSHTASPHLHPHLDDDEGYISSSSDTLPAHLLPHYDPATGRVLGRSPSMVMYLLMKAKHRYALEQHEQLLEQLRVTRAELKRERDEKEVALDKVLKGIFGPQAEPLIAPVPSPGGHGGQYIPGPSGAVYVANVVANVNGR